MGYQCRNFTRKIEAADARPFRSNLRKVIAQCREQRFADDLVEDCNAVVCELIHADCYIAFTMLSVIFLASPNSIMVLSR